MSVNATTRRSRLFDLVAAAMLLSANLLLTGPLLVYWQNLGELTFGFSVLAPLLVPVFLLAVALLVAVGWSLPTRAYWVFQGLLFALALLTWAQAAFLIPNYGVFDGRGLDWESAGWRGRLDVALWLVVSVLCLRFVRRARLGLRVACLVLLVLAPAVPLVTDLAGDERSWSDFHNEPTWTDHGIFQYSTNQNVIHLILDSFQTDVFLELVEEQGWHDEFDGFVLFEDNLSIASQTSFAVPAIMSGIPFDGSVTTEQYYQAAIDEGSISNALVDAGYAVNLITHLNMKESAYTAYLKAPVEHGMSQRKQRTREASFLVDVALFRSVPHMLRGTIYNAGNWQLTRVLVEPPSVRTFHQKAFLRDYLDLISPTLDQPAYHFMHLMPPHPPYATLADGSFAGETLPYTRENHVHEARAILKLFLEWLDELRKRGLYVSSLIVLQGDHGTDHAPVWNGQPVELPVGRSAGLLAVKRVGAKGALQRSTVATSTADVAATLMAELELPAAPGVSVFEQTLEGAQRVRRFYTYEVASGGEASLSRFDVRGDVFDPSAWEGPFSSDMVALSPHYEWGTVLSFGTGGNADPYLRQGWSSPMSPEYRWTNGPRATLQFEVDPPGESVVVQLVFAPYVDPKLLPRQRITVLCNGHEVTKHEGTEHKASIMVMKVAERAFGSGQLTLEFDLPDAASPRSLGRGGDERQLGIFVSRMVMFPESKPPVTEKAER